MLRVNSVGMNGGLGLINTIVKSLVLGLLGSPLVAQAAEVPRDVAYVTSQNGDVTVYSLKDYSVIKHLPLYGRGLGLSADGRFLVVAESESADLGILDTVTGQVVHKVTVGKNPEFVKVLGDIAFVAYEPEATGGPPPKPGTPEFEAMKAKLQDDDAEEPARVAMVNLRTGQKIKEIEVGVETEGIEFSADGKHIIVTNEADENVSVHDIATGKTIKVIDTQPLGIRPRGVKRSPDGLEYAVTLEYGDKIVFLDKDYNVTREVATGKVPYGVTYNRDGSEVWVALARGKTMQVFDSQTLQLKREFPLGTRCWHFTFTPDDSQVWVACGRSSEVMVLDAKTGQLIKSLPDDKMPWGVVTYPSSVGSLSHP